MVRRDGEKDGEEEGDEEKDGKRKEMGRESEEGMEMKIGRGEIQKKMGKRKGMERKEMGRVMLRRDGRIETVEIGRKKKRLGRDNDGGEKLREQ